MAKITLSIPDQLKQRMDQLDANWGQVATEAFDFMVKHLENIDRRLAKSTIDRAGERLRLSKQSWYRLQEDMIDSVGSQLGRNWALNSASYEQLRNIAASAQDLTIKPPSADAVVYSMSYPPDYPEQFEPDLHPGRDTIREFWMAHAASYHDIALANGDLSINDEALGEAFRLAFVEGALEVWAEVADQI